MRIDDLDMADVQDLRDMALEYDDETAYAMAADGSMITGRMIKGGRFLAVSVMTAGGIEDLATFHAT